MPRRSGGAGGRDRDARGGQGSEHVRPVPAEARVRGDPRWLVDDDEVGVLVQDRQVRDRAGDHDRPDGSSSRSTSSSAPPRARSDFATAAPSRRTRPGGDQVGAPTPGEPEDPGDDGVDPLALEPLGDEQDLRVAHAVAIGGPSPAASRPG